MALELPIQVVSPVDVGRLLRELEALDETLLQLNLRGGRAGSLPAVSHLLGQTLELQGLNGLMAADRQQLVAYLADIKERAPVLHMSFSADPPPAFTEQLLSWLRREIHPWLLLTIGLQPTIGAGCVIRTPNKQFDISLRQDFLKKRELLLTQLAAPATNSEGIS